MINTEDNAQQMEEAQEDAPSEILELLQQPDISSAVRIFAEAQKAKTHNTTDANKRRQWASYVILAGIVTYVAILTYCGQMGESAAAGIFGAVVGHIFSRVNTGDK